MTIAYIIIYLIDAIWIFIPIKQRHTKYFYYFLIWAVAIFILTLNQFFFGIHPAYYYLVLYNFLILSLFDFWKIPYKSLLLPGLLIITVVPLFFISIDTITILLIIQHLIIFFIILKRVVVYSSSLRELNLFHFVLLFYEITLVMRYTVVLKDIETGILFFYLTASLGIFIGIFFLFYNEKNSLRFSLK